MQSRPLPVLRRSLVIWAAILIEWRFPIIDWLDLMASRFAFDGETTHMATKKIMSLSADEFIRRFLLHVLPRGLMRIRHYGLQANRDRHKRLARCRELIGQAEPVPGKTESVEEMMLRLTGIDITACPKCHTGKLRQTQSLLPVRPLKPTPQATGPPSDA